MIKCKKCLKNKPLSEFQIVDKERGWHRHECKACTKKRLDAWVVNNQGRVKTAKERYYDRNQQKVIETATKWNKGHKKKHNSSSMTHYYRRQHEAIMAYGGYRCACCGETEPLFLTIDHVNNDGNKHRKQFQSSGDGLYKWLRKNGYPNGFQVLCMNCNFGKRRNSGICPHKGISHNPHRYLKRTSRDHSERK